MKNLIEQIRSGKGVEALNAIKSSLNKKTLVAVEEAKQGIAESVYGGSELTEEINTDHPSFKAGHKSYETNVKEPAKTVAGQTRKNNHNKLDAKKAHVAKFGTLPEKLKAGQHFEAGYDAAHAKHAYEYGKKEGWMKESIDLTEAGSLGDYHHIATSHGYKKVGEPHTSASTDPVTGAGGLYGGGITSHKYEHPEGHRITISQRPGQLRGDKPRLSFTAGSPTAGGPQTWGKTPAGLEAHLKKAHSVKESFIQEGSGGAIPWPAQSKHLKDYKKNEAGEYVHPEGHKITVNKEKGEITHTTKDGKSKTFKHLGDLHPHLSKLHHGFDEKVKEHTVAHQGGGIEQNRLHHKMGALSYKFHKPGYDHANHEEDATNYKAMHKALMNLSKRDRGVR